MENLVERAKAFAIAAHGEQKYGDKPYEVHLQAVADVVRRHNYGELLEACAWLHDVVEDCPTVSLKDIADTFGQEVAEIVWSVTDEPGKNRKERKAATYAKTKESYYGVKLKLCDRIANVEACIADENKQLFAMYFKEHEDFMVRLGLRRDYVIFSKRLLRDELDKLVAKGAFRFIS